MIKIYILYDISKRVQPPTYSSGINIKRETILLVLGTMENLLDGEL